MDKNEKDIINQLKEEVEYKEMKITAKDCIIRQQKNRILQLESELANAKIDADSANLTLLITQSNEAARKRYRQVDLIYLAIFLIGITSFIASKF